MICCFGVSVVDEKLREMRMVWISYIYVDYYVGLLCIFIVCVEIFC